MEDLLGRDLTDKEVETVTENATTVSEHKWPAGEIKLNAPSESEVEKADISNLTAALVSLLKVAVQHGPSDLYRRHGGTPEDGDYGVWAVKDGEFYFNLSAFSEDEG